ncbi:MAG: DUF6365 family protein [Candidatus Sericytochromatia bacterium]
MNYVFIILGVDSFYESTILSKLIQEIPDESGIVCLAGELPYLYLTDNERLLKVLLKGSEEENKATFDDILNEGQISAIFILDFHKTFFTKYYNHDYGIIPFNLKWLEDINIPINVIDPLDTLSYNEENKIYLKNSADYNVEDDILDEDAEINTEDTFKGINKDGDQVDVKPLEDESTYVASDMVSKFNFYPNIVKLCPPCIPSSNENSKFIYLDFAYTHEVNQYIDQMKAPLGISDEKKNVLLIFSYQMMMNSVVQNNLSHYMRVISTLVIYLKKLDIPINLFIIGADSSLAQHEMFRGSKISFRAFKNPNHNLYKTLITYANVLITDTTWHPSLIDGAKLNIPAGVIGNSARFNEEGVMEASFESTDPEVFKILEKAVKEAPQTLFPFTCYPLKEKEIPDFTYYDEIYPYYLLDIYSDESTLSFLGEFLVSEEEEVLDNLKDYQEVYFERANGAINTLEMLMMFEKFN